ncbi:integrase catalytic domain-containing protein [Acidithrix ferrooxidans]|uniref:Integrase core domain protein n=1 Tax=Acidithrix ferrooxidans TaxID=1280514 RepID=A0A0D8HLE0_9ACTN|nr:integrase core domain protein [Acidithrix ferrooxidans]
MDQLGESIRNAYVIIDLYSRKIVGWEVYESESSEQLKRVVKRAIARENMAPKVIHSDNGSPMKGWSLVEYLYELVSIVINSFK